MVKVLGHFPETVKPGFNGYLAEPEDIDSMADTMLHFLNNPIDGANVGQTTDRFSWENYARAIVKSS